MGLLALMLLALGTPRRVLGAATRAEQEGQELAAELCAQRPNENLTTSGVLQARDSAGQLRLIPVKLRVILHEADWESIYEALTTNGVCFERLVVVHHPDQPNQYRLTRGEGASATTQTLTGEQADVGFAGTDFWLSDLGLEFFHWPEERLLRKEMRLSRSCRVLEGLNPKPQSGGYARVLSWIDFEYHNIIRAEAFDAKRKLVKLFSLGRFKKVNGRWQLKEMQITNVQADTRTTLKFDLTVK